MILALVLLVALSSHHLLFRHGGLHLLSAVLLIDYSADLGRFLDDPRNGPGHPRAVVVSSDPSSKSAAEGAAFLAILATGPAIFAPSSSPDPSSKSTAEGSFGFRQYADPHYLWTGMVSKSTNVYGFGVLLLKLIMGLPAVGLEEGRVLTAEMRP